jgi:hypothetical protein
MAFGQIDVRAESFGRIGAKAMKTTDQEAADRCEACLGTKQDSSMHSPYPYGKLLWVDRPACKGTGKKPKAS